MMGLLGAAEPIGYGLKSSPRNASNSPADGRNYSQNTGHVGNLGNWAHSRSHAMGSNATFNSMAAGKNLWQRPQNPMA